MAESSPGRTLTSRYGAAVLLSLAALAVRVALHPVLGDAVRLQMFTLAVVLSAWWGGLGPGLVATALGAGAGTFFFLDPTGSFRLQAAGDGVRIGVFLLNGIAISWIAEALHRAARRGQAQLERLRLQEERLRLAVQATQDAVWDLDIEAGKLEWSPAITELFGWRVEEAGATPDWWQQHLHPDDRARVVAEVNAVIADPACSHWEAEYRFLRADGSVAFVFDRGTVLRDARGRGLRMIGAMMDLTARREAELSTRRNREQLQTIIDTVPALICYVDREYIYRWNSRAYERWFRRPLAEITGRSMRELMGEAAFERVKPMVDRALAGEGCEFEDLLPYESMEPRWMHGLYAPHRAPDGSVDGVAVAVTDVTERKRAEAEMQSAGLQRRLALEAAGMGTWNWNIRDGTIEWSERTYELFGLPPRVPVNYELFHAAIHPEDLPRVDGRIAESLTHESRHYQAEYRVVRPDGKTCWVLAEGAVHLDPASGEPARMIGVIMDVTDRVLAGERLAAALAAAETANRAKDDFLAALSHELRTPLTPVLFLAATQERAPDVPARLREDFAMIRRNIELEARLIDDLLDLTRISRGKLQLEMEPTDLHDVLERSIELLENELQSRQIDLRIDLAAEHHVASADPVRLQQVFWNVLKNSVKFTPEGGCITVHSRSGPGNVWHLAISDSGLGITAEELPRIFEAFAQGHEASSHRFGGLGLGLAISSLLMSEHAGRIRAESAGRGQGATFHFELPLLAPGAVVHPTPVLAAALQGEASQRILVVEDHEHTRETLKRLLRRRGYKVTVARTVAQAREHAAETRFDLMISDVGLPDGNGRDLAAEFLREYGLKAIALSGYGMEEDIRRSIAAGFLDHITKPVDIEALHSAITRALGAETATA
jgi:PAS domain S-box-containing protein